MEDIKSFCESNGLGHLAEDLIGDGVTLDILLQCTDSELTLLTKRAVDKIKLRIAIDKLRVQTSRQSPTESRSSSDVYVSLPVRETTTICVEPVTSDQKLASTLVLASTPVLSSTPEQASTPELTLTPEPASTPELSSAPKLTSTPECILTPALPSPSNAFLTSDSLLELKDEDITFLNNVDLSNLGKEPGRSLHQLLSSVTLGKVLLQKASKGEKLNSRDRAFIVKLIVEAELRSLHEVTNSIRKEIWENWASEVVSLFPGEAKEIYYIPYHVIGGKVIQASGLFHNRLITHRRLLATSTNKKRKSSSSSSDSGVFIEKNIKRNRPLPKSFQSSSDINSTTESCLDWLRSSSSPNDLVAAKWVATFELRNKLLSGSLSHEEYFKTFPALTLPNGHDLLTLDFLTLYPTADQVFFERFPVIKTRILNLLAEKGGTARVDESTLELLNLASVGEEQASLAAILAIPNLLRQMPTISVPRKKTWKLSREEVRTSFVGRVATVSDIERFCADRQAFVAVKGIPEQPYILAVGPSWDQVTQYEIVIHKGQRYQCNDICSAIRITYHIYWALDSAYSKDSAVCWMFVQRAFFNMKSKFDTEGVPLRELLHKLND